MRGGGGGRTLMMHTARTQIGIADSHAAATDADYCDIQQQAASCEDDILAARCVVVARR